MAAAALLAHSSDSPSPRHRPRAVRAPRRLPARLPAAGRARERGCTCACARAKVRYACACTRVPARLLCIDAHARARAYTTRARVHTGIRACLRTRRPLRTCLRTCVHAYVPWQVCLRARAHVPARACQSAHAHECGREHFLRRAWARAPSGPPAPRSSLPHPARGSPPGPAQARPRAPPRSRVTAPPARRTDCRSIGREPPAPPPVASLPFSNMAAPASRTPTRRRHLGSLPSGAATEKGRKKPAWELYGFARWVAWRSRLVRSLPPPRPRCTPGHSGSSFLPTPARREPSELAPRRYPRCSQDGGAGLGLRASESAREGAPAGPARPALPPRRAAPPASPGRSPLPSPHPRPRPRLLRPGAPTAPPAAAAAPVAAGAAPPRLRRGASSPAARPRAQRGPRMSPGGGGGSDREQQAAAPRSVGAAQCPARGRAGRGDGARPTPALKGREPGGGPARYPPPGRSPAGGGEGAGGGGAWPRWSSSSSP